MGRGAPPRLTPFSTPTKEAPRKLIPITRPRREATTTSNSSCAHLKNLMINKVNLWPPVAINQGWFIRNDGFLDLF